MLIIRLQRVGKTNQAYYRLVIAEKGRAASGKFLEMLGSVDPHQKINRFKKERILYWIANGAQLSDTVHNLFVKEKIIDQAKRKVILGKKKKQSEEATPAPAATPAAPENSAPVTPKEEQTPEAPKAPETPKADEAPKAPEEPKAPEAPETPEAPKAPEEPNVAETPESTPAEK